MKRMQKKEPVQHLTIPNKLYGREHEKITMLGSFEHIRKGHGEVLLVPGPSGVGKTALIQELQIPVLDKNGFFVRGKFEQYQQNVPYFAFRQALAELYRGCFAKSHPPCCNPSKKGYNKAPDCFTKNQLPKVSQ